MLNSDTDVAPKGEQAWEWGTGSVPMQHGWHRLTLRVVLTRAGTGGIPAPPAPCLPLWLWRILHLLPPFQQQQPEQAATKIPRGEVVPGGTLPACCIHRGAGAHREGSALPLPGGFPPPPALLQMLSRDAQPRASASQSLRGLRADRRRRGTPAAPAPARHATQLQRRVTLPAQRLHQLLLPPRRQR